MRLTLWAAPLLIITAIIKLNGATINDFDTWWHLKAGLSMIASGEVPHKEMWSWTATGSEWIAHEWLAEISMGIAYLIGKTNGLLAWLCLGITLNAWLYSKLLNRQTSNQSLLFLATMLIWPLTIEFWAVRPQVIAYALFLATWLVLEEYSTKPKLAYLLPVILVIWANAHGSWFLYFVMIGVYILAHLGNWQIGNITSKAWDKSRVRCLIVISAISLPLVMLNPNTYHLYPYPFAVASNQVMIDFIREWWSPNFHKSLFLLIIFGLVPGLVALGKVKVEHMMFLLWFMILALNSYRNIIYFVLVLGVVLCNVLHQRLKSPNLSLSKLAGLIILLAVLLGGWLWPANSVAQAKPEVYPVEAMKHLPAGRLYNHYGWGGYLTYHGIPVFIDGRADIYLEKLLPDYVTISQLHEGWTEKLREYQIDVVLDAKDSRLVQALKMSPEWEKVYQDDTATVMKKKG